jgi:hypothetical protein
VNRAPKLRHGVGDLSELGVSRKFEPGAFLLVVNRPALPIATILINVATVGDTHRSPHYARDHAGAPAQSEPTADKTKD